MIKVTVLYPETAGAKFDFDHYLNVHMPMSIRLLGDKVREVSVERGVSPGQPWPDKRFVAICTFLCESQSDYEAAFFPAAEQLQGDMPNYTDIEPIIQISEVAIAHRAG